MLALALGGRTIAEWQEVMSSEEFVDWQIYYEMNPFGPKRDDFNAALIARTIAQANAPKGKRFQLKDFLLEFRSRYDTRERESMSPEQITGFMQQLKDRQEGNA